MDISYYLSDFYSKNKNYKLFKNKYGFSLYYSIENSDPFIIIKDNNTYLFFITNKEDAFNMAFCSCLTLMSVEGFKYLFDFNKNVEFNYISIIKGNAIISEFISNSLILKYKKESFLNNDLFYLNYLNKGTHEFIKKVKINNVDSYYYYDFNIEENKLITSFDLSYDLPLEIINNQNQRLEIYVNPLIKKNMNDILKPTEAIYINNILYSYTYIINKEDKTKFFKDKLKKLNIKNPITHVFSDKERDFILFDL